MIKSLISDRRKLQLALRACARTLVAGCGGGRDRDSGAKQATLSVAANDAEGNPFSYQWRVTGGTVDNRNAARAVLTMTPGHGLHCAYVTVSDGKGGYEAQQYAVSTDALDIAPSTSAAISLANPVLAGFNGVTGRLGLMYQGQIFVPAAGGAPVERYIYAPSVRVELRTAAGQTDVAGVSDESGEVQLPAQAGSYGVWCSTSRNSLLVNCNNTVTFEDSGEPTALDEEYVPGDWTRLERGDFPGTPARSGSTCLYHEVVISSCPTRHDAYKCFDWDESPFSIVVPTTGPPSPYDCSASPDSPFGA